MNKQVITGIVATGIILVASCGKNGGGNPISQGPAVIAGNLIKSTLPRANLTSPAADISMVTDGNNSFGWSLFNKLHTDNTNMFFSPYSVSTAVAMAWQGARGETKSEITQALDFALDSIRFNIAMNAIDLGLAQRGQSAAGREGKGFTIQCANALWGEKTETFLPGFLDPLGQYFGAGMRVCDFKNNSELARIEINDTVASQTKGKILELIPNGQIDPLTRLVLTNTVYFDAAWADTFDHQKTPGDFFRSTDDTIQTWYMRRTGMYNYSEDGDFQMLEIPYDGNQVSMVVLLPKSADSLNALQPLSNEKIKTLLSAMSIQEVSVSLPKYTFTFGTVSLNNELIALGMQKAFSPAADFSGINGTRGLALSQVLHQAFVAVDGKGTTAAAATAIVGYSTASPFPPNRKIFDCDHPFVFFIRDIPTNQILFMGYLAAPTVADR
jgi:serpin B